MALTWVTQSPMTIDGPSTAPARDESSDRIASADMRADAVILRKALETIHPGLYRYNTRSQMAAHFDALDAAFSHDLSRQQAFLALSQFTATIKCGHTFQNPNNQSRAVVTSLFLRQDKVPFYFRGSARG